MHFKRVHVVMLASAAVAAGLPNLLSEFPAGMHETLRAAAAVCALLAGVLGAVSGSAVKKGPKP